MSFISSFFGTISYFSGLTTELTSDSTIFNPLVADCFPVSVCYTTDSVPTTEAVEIKASRCLPFVQVPDGVLSNFF